MASENQSKTLEDQLSEYEYIRFTLVDINGIARSKLVPSSVAGKFLEKGIGFYNGVLALGPNNEISLEITKLLKFGNITAKPAIKEIFYLPWAANGKSKIGEILCEPFWMDDTIVEEYTRNIALKQLDKVEKMGYKLYSAFEVECIIVQKETGEPDSKSTHFLGAFGLSTKEELFCEFEKKLKLSNIQLETISCEYDPGQYEFTFNPLYGIDAADTVFRFKQAMKEMCNQKGYHITFMARPSAHGFSNGLHFNHSLWTLASNKNVFYDSDKVDNLSDIAMNYIGGLIKHSDALIAFCAPTTSCYRRLCGPVVPAKADWGIDHRFSSFRIKNTSSSETYIENRLPSGSSNPYLVLAATLAAGIDGIVNKISAPEQKLENAKSLPKSLKDTLVCLENDQVIVDAIGREFIEWYLRCKKTSDIDKFGNHNLDKLIPEEFEAEKAQCFEQM